MKTYQWTNLSNPGVISLSFSRPACATSWTKPATWRTVKSQSESSKMRWVSQVSDYTWGIFLSPRSMSNLWHQCRWPSVCTTAQVSLKTKLSWKSRWNELHIQKDPEIVTYSQASPFCRACLEHSRKKSSRWSLSIEGRTHNFSNFFLPIFISLPNQLFSKNSPKKSLILMRIFLQKPCFLSND